MHPVERGRRHGFWIWLGLCGLTPAHRAAAQVSLSVELHLLSYGGTSRDTSVGNQGQTFRPYRPLLFTLRPAWTVGRVRADLGISYGTPDLAEDGDPLAVVFHDASTLLELAPEVSVGLARLSSGLALRAHAGPLLDHWQLSGEDGWRNRAGAVAALSGEFPVARKLHAVLRLSGGLTSGLFSPGDLPPEFELRRMWRFGIGLGLRYGR